MSTILVSGSVAYDRIMKFPGSFKEHIHADKMHVLSVSFTVDTLEESFGGTAGNIVYNLALLGEKPSLLASVGGDFPKYSERLLGLGVDIQNVQHTSRLTCPVAHIISDDDDNQIAAFYPGSIQIPYEKEVAVADLAIVAPGNIKDMQVLPEKFRGSNTPFLYDPGQMITVLTGEMLRSAIPGAAAIMGNDYEINLVLKKTGWSKKVLSEKVGAIVTTLGAEGSTVTTKDKEIRVAPVTAIEVLDPTGAGDAHRAGFAVAYLRGLPMEICAQVASTVAVYAVEMYGTQKHVFSRKELASRYQAAYGSSFPLEVY